MATTFELFILHPEGQYAEQAAHDVFRAIDRLEGDFSRFIENSDVSRINLLGEGKTVQVGLDTFNCLNKCKKLHQVTQGAFDITVGFLVDMWKNSSETDGKKTITQDEINSVLRNTGMNHLVLDEEALTVSSTAPNIRVDLGGVGKGFALDEGLCLLKEWEIGPVLLHGGMSSVFASGAPQGEKGWPVTISHPYRKEILHTLYLKDEAISGSGFLKGQHIIDPRTGLPVEGKIAVWAVADNCTESDALSTAFAVMGSSEIKTFCSNHNVSAMIITSPREDDGFEQIFRYGAGFE
jgi:thiamine biosynthesis lipoprotein